MIRAATIFLVALATPVAAAGQSAMPAAPYAYRQLADPNEEAQARALMHELRCLVCAGQTIADSDAPMAGDMRSQIRQRIAAGEQPASIRRWMIQRYGDWVSYSPPMDGSALALWLGPVAVLLLSLWIAKSRFRHPGLPAEDDA
jgi:cytochrome c-type biogenesis protein CcmH